MRTLLVLRHAKSDWDAGVEDHARPLAERGRKAAARVGRFLALAGPRPDIVVTSSATRARDTATRAIKAAGWKKLPVHETDALYEVTVDGALGVVRAMPDEAAVAMLVGHEPTLSDLVGGLIGRATVAMATGTLATIEFDVASWSEAGLGSGVLTRLVPARSLEGLGLKSALRRKGAAAGRHDTDG